MRLVRKRAPIYAGLTFYAILAGLPIYWMIITTFKPDQDLYNLANFPLFFNKGGVTLDHTTGELYGSATDGGAYGGGVLFKLDSDGAETVLHNFDPGTDGDFPRGRLIRDKLGDSCPNVCLDKALRETTPPLSEGSGRS